MEKLLKKRALHDEYIKKRLSHLSIEPNKDRTIRNVVEDCTALTEENERLKRDNKSLKEQLDYAVSNAGDQNPNEMTVFANNIKPIPQFEELNRIRDQTKSKELYMRKLEEMLRSALQKCEKFKDDLTASKSEVSLLKERVEYFDRLSTKLRQALVKYKGKCEDLESRIKDQGVKVWVKENTGCARVKPASALQGDNSQEETNYKDIGDEDIELDLAVAGEARAPNDKCEAEEVPEDVFAPKDDSIDKHNEGPGGALPGFGFIDQTTILVDPEADDHDSADEELHE